MLKKTCCSLTHKFEYDGRMSYKSFTKVNSYLMLKFNYLMVLTKTLYGFSN